MQEDQVRAKTIHSALTPPPKRLPTRRSRQSKVPVLPPPDSVLQAEQGDSVSPSIPESEREEEKAKIEERIGTSSVVVEPEESIPEVSAARESQQETNEQEQETATESQNETTGVTLVIPDIDDELIQRVGTSEEALSKPISIKFYEELFPRWEQLTEEIKAINPQLRVASIARVGILVWLKFDPLIRRLISILGPQLKMGDFWEIELLNNIARIYRLTSFVPQNPRRFTPKETSVGLTVSEIAQLDDLQRCATQACKFVPNPHKQLLKSSQVRLALWLLTASSIDWKGIAEPDSESITSINRFKDDFEERASTTIITWLNQQASTR